jgi:hypothetical protein
VVTLDTWQVIIESAVRPPSEVFAELASLRLADREIDVEFWEPPEEFRSADPAVIVATISAASASLTALITGLLQLRGNRAGGRISIELASGGKLEVPADYPPAEIDALLKTIAKETPQRLILP